MLIIFRLSRDEVLAQSSLRLVGERTGRRMDADGLDETGCCVARLGASTGNDFHRCASYLPDIGD